MTGHEWIYQLIYRDRSEDGSLWQMLPSRRKQQKPRIRGRSGHGQIPDRVMISDRLAEVDYRSRLGDWEGDSIIGRGNRSSLVSLLERRSRYLRLLHPENRSAEATAEAIIGALRTEVVETVTVDNGKEFSQHQRIAKELGVSVYFADPYSSWQCGSNEHVNGMVRRHYSKGTDFTRVSDTELKIIEDRLNNRPRKLLGYATPWKVYPGKALPPVALQT